MTDAMPASGSLPPYVQIIGCSNSSLIYQSYDYYSTLHSAVDSAVGGASLHYWATEDSVVWTGGLSPRGHDPVPGFEANFAAYGASAVWYPVCIQANDYPSNGKAYGDLKKFVTLLRKRTAAPLYLSAGVGEQPTCSNDDAKQAYVVDHAVADGQALRAPDVPPASAPCSDGCHFDPVLSSNVGEAAVSFLDG